MTNTEMKQILAKIDGEYCWECVFNRTKILTCHHALIHDQKKYHGVLTNVVNCCLLCMDCHQSGTPNSHRWRLMFLHDRIDKLGKDAVMAWWLSLPEKLRLTNAWIGIELEGE